MAHITTWRKIFETSPLTENSSKIVFCTYTDEKLDEEFDTQAFPYGDFETLTIWTKDYVYAPSFRDGQMILVIQPRNPTLEFTKHNPAKYINHNLNLNVKNDKKQTADKSQSINEHEIFVYRKITTQQHSVLRIKARNYQEAREEVIRQVVENDMKVPSETFDGWQPVCFPETKALYKKGGKDYEIFVADDDIGEGGDFLNIGSDDRCRGNNE